MSPRRALFLSSVMMQGYGVSVVAHEIAERISAYGWELLIGSLTVDDGFRAAGVIDVGTDPAEVADLCRRMGISVVVAQTTPYFEMLPSLADEFATVVFEHGDPSPHFFDADGPERERIKLNKLLHVYPRVHKVLASSHFLRHDVGWPSADVVPLGCDHVPDLGPKDLSQNAHRRSAPMRVGTLMRLGEGESKYKGVEHFVRLVEHFEHDDRIEFAIMGRGTDQDRDRWEALGVETHINASDAERADYLRDLDVLISPSMWEGFNLPLVEAQASGTVGLAFDVGAHPETTPYLLSDVDDAIQLIGAWVVDRDQVARASRVGYRYARSKFSWETAARLLASHLNEVAPAPVDAHSSDPGSAAPSRLMRLAGLVDREGPLGACRTIARRVSGRLTRALSSATRS